MLNQLLDIFFNSYPQKKNDSTNSSSTAIWTLKKIWWYDNQNSGCTWICYLFGYIRSIQNCNPTLTAPTNYVVFSLSNGKETSLFQIIWPLSKIICWTYITITKIRMKYCKHNSDDIVLLSVAMWLIQLVKLNQFTPLKDLFI